MKKLATFISELASLALYDTSHNIALVKTSISTYFTTTCHNDEPLKLKFSFESYG